MSQTVPKTSVPTGEKRKNVRAVFPWCAAARSQLLSYYRNLLYSRARTRLDWCLFSLCMGLNGATPAPGCAYTSSCHPPSSPMSQALQAVRSSRHTLLHIHSHWWSADVCNLQPPLTGRYKKIQLTHCSASLLDHAYVNAVELTLKASTKHDNNKICDSLHLDTSSND